MNRSLIAILMLVTLPVGGVAAQTSVGQRVAFTLAQDLVQRVVVSGKATEQIVENPKTVQPGDVLREQVTLRNVSGQRLSGLLVNVPVPRGTEFSVLGTPDTSRWTAQYSVDGGKTFSAAPRRTVTVTENGRAITRQENAPPSSYTNVRWTVTLSPDETLKLSFRVKVK
ncbi:hypothetical protein K7W42_06780 [Deinococcus sp. HMF7604]|uniref:hypothetical protein n=1 Tax=Deinococcus betulae TaxID=2873312 RepID=UPI001CCBE9CC|nr:hypothetical protein [Deinococcus betulae]MBZ9750563.1 hypothetical protein [Deinococcus betulae]